MILGATAGSRMTNSEAKANAIRDPLAAYCGDTGAGVLGMKLLEIIGLAIDGLGKFLGRLEFTEKRHVLESLGFYLVEFLSESGQVRFGYDNPIIKNYGVQCANVCVHGTNIKKVTIFCKINLYI